jgi:hypothetical protein
MAADRFFQSSKYHSRECRICLRPYLFPFYGGRYQCNDCTMAIEDDHGYTYARH